MAHSTLVGLLRDLYVEASDSRSITWIHVKSHGGELDPSKQHLLPLSERADRWAESGRSRDPCFNLRRWVYTIGTDEPELAVERRRILFLLGLLASMRLDVDLGRELSQPLSAESVGGNLHNTLAERNVSHTNNTVWARPLQTLHADNVGKFSFT